MRARRGGSYLLCHIDVCIANQRSHIDYNVSHISKCVELLGAHTTREQWPEKTDVACWNCTFEFDAIPIAVPKSLRHRKHFDKCYGVFCSFNCAKRYVITQNNFDMWSQLQLLSLLHKRVLGCTVKVIPAPPRQALLRFGGYLSIDEYRKNNIVLPPEPDMFDPSVRRDIYP